MHRHKCNLSSIYTIVLLYLQHVVNIFVFSSQAWERLEKAEHERELALRNELIRQEKLEMLAARFDRKAAMRETWLSENQRLVSQVTKILSLSFTCTFLLWLLPEFDDELNFVVARTTLEPIWEQWKLPHVNMRPLKLISGHIGSAWLLYKLLLESLKQRTTMM